MFSWESTPCPTLLVLMAGPVDNREWAAGRQVRTAVAAPYPSCCFHKAHFSAHEGEMSCKRPIFKMTLRKIIKAWSYQWITTVLYFAKHYFLFKRTSAPRNTDSSVLWYFRGTMVSPTPWGTGTLIPPRASPPLPAALGWQICRHLSWPKVLRGLLTWTPGSGE